MSTFKILWFEDSIENFDKIIVSLKAHAAVLNRDFDYDHFDSYPLDFDVKMFNGDHSVAFIDLNLKNGQKGTEIIDTLVAKGTFMDILLYSNNPIELEQLTEGVNYVEGVFRHATMEGIESKMIEMMDIVNYKEIMVLKRYGF
jgi:hypothetical protein